MKRDRSPPQLAPRKRQLSTASLESTLSEITGTSGDTEPGLMRPRPELMSCASSSRVSESGISDCPLSPAQSPRENMSQDPVKVGDIQNDRPAITTCAHMSAFGLATPPAAPVGSSEATIVGGPILVSNFTYHYRIRRMLRVISTIPSLRLQQITHSPSPFLPSIQAMCSYTAAWLHHRESGNSTVPFLSAIHYGFDKLCVFLSRPNRADSFTGGYSSYSRNMMARSN